MSKGASFSWDKSGFRYGKGKKPTEMEHRESI